MDGRLFEKNPAHEMNASSDQRTSSKTFTPLWMWPAGLVVGGMICMFTLDYEVGRHFAANRVDGILERFLDASEHFGTFYGQVLILVVIGSLSHWWEPRIVRLLAASSAAGLAVNLLKLTVGRYRPHSFEFLEEGLWTAFDRWWPLGAGGSALQSFPSGHSASAAGFAVALSWVYPRGWPAFYFLMALVGLHRVFNAAHFPSDVCFGLAVGWVVARAFVTPGPLCSQFDAWERTWATWNPWPRTNS